jgi:hypothetical protein
LLDDIRNNEPASGNVLDLSQPDALSAQLFDDGRCGLGGPAGRFQMQLLSDRLHDSRIGLTKRAAIFIKYSQIRRDDTAPFQSVAE